MGVRSTYRDRYDKQRTHVKAQFLQEGSTEDVAYVGIVSRFSAHGYIKFVLLQLSGM